MPCAKCEASLRTRGCCSPPVEFAQGRVSSPPADTGGLAKRTPWRVHHLGDSFAGWPRRTRQGAAQGSGGSVQADRRRPQPGSGSRRAVQGHPDPGVGAAVSASGRPCASSRTARRSGRGEATGVGEVVEVRFAVTVGGQHRAARARAARRRPPRRRRPRTTSRWNRLPAMARTHLPLYGSTASPANTTASAPAASAVRSTVPALPGSRTSGEHRDQRGPAGRARRPGGTSSCWQTATSALRRDGLGQRGERRRR